MRELDWPDPFVGLDPMEHKHALSEPYTKETWRDYLYHSTPPRPDRLNRTEYHQLTHPARDAFDHARLAYNASLSIVRTEPVTRLERTIRNLLYLNQGAQPSAGLGLMVDGETRTGKSTAVKYVLRRYEHALRMRCPHYFDRPGDEFIPVAFVQTPQTSPTVGSALLRAITTFYAMPVPNRATIPDLQEAAVKAIRRCGTKVIVFDDLHFLDLGASAGRDANNLLKALANKVAVTFVCIGVELEHTQLFTEGMGNSRATQTSGRYTLLEVDKYNADDQQSVTEWVAFIRAIDDQIVLLDHVSGSLAGQWKYLYDRTQGHIGAVYNLVRLAALQAFETEEEALTQEVMDRVTIDILSESRTPAA